MRRILSSLLVALIVSAALPLTVLGATQASGGTATTNEDTGVTITLTARDQTNGLPITQFSPAAAAHGTVGAPGPITCDSTGPKRCHSDVLYTPAANYNGADQFNFTATGPDGPDTATITITITAVNDAPACVGDTSTGDEDTDQTGTVGCTDIDSGALTYSKVGGPAHGAATVNANGSWTYTPAANYNGSDSFTFRAGDGTLFSGTVTMSLTIQAVNDAPTCANDASIGDKNQQQTGTIVCADVDDANLTIAKVSGPSHGSANVATDGDWTYMPVTSFSGSDAFTFRASDGNLNSSNATMQLTISATNAAPVCADDSSSGDEDQDQSGTITCTDGDDDELTYTKVGSPTHGTATVDADGSWTYHPNPDFHGSDSFTFRANDGSVNSTAETMSITVDSVNDAPDCADDTSSGAEEAGQSGSLACTDVDGDDLTFTKVGDTTDGTSTVDADGDWTYTPDPNFFGSDDFTFRANDGTVDSNTATMSITVTGTNDVPVCAPDTQLGRRGREPVGHDHLHRPRRRRSRLQQGHRSHQRQRDRRPERRLDLRPRPELQRRRRLHLPGQRRPGVLGHGDDVDHGRRRERRAGLPPPTPAPAPRTRTRAGTVQLHGRRGRRPDVQQGQRPGGRHGHRRRQRRLDLQPGPGLPTAPTASPSAPTTAN